MSQLQNLESVPRRDFLQQSSTLLGATCVAPAMATVLGAAPSQKITLGWIGTGGQGTGLLKSFLGQPDVDVAAVCDVDRDRSSKGVELVTASGRPRPQAFQDLRQLLDLKAIDGVVIATPDHWHGPATLLALQAGKHVYVEKPCAHNLREGRLMIEAARKAQRVVQVGTQSRSSPMVIEAIRRLREGAIGEIIIAKAWNSQLRTNIGHARPTTPPDNVNYDLWIGPAPFVPYQANRFHYNWHWWYAFGTGDAGNDGVHELDIAHWGLGAETHPSHIWASGGKYVQDDDQQFPDTQYVVFEYPTLQGKELRGKESSRPRQLIYEHRIWSPYRQEGIENGVAFYGTKGYLIVGKNDGWQLFGPKNKLIDRMSSVSAGSAHHRNFLDSIRTGERPNADIEIGHHSAALSHLANIATRVGERLEFDPQTETFPKHPAAQQLVSREYRPDHWAIPLGLSKHS